MIAENIETIRQAFEDYVESDEENKNYSFYVINSDYFDKTKDNKDKKPTFAISNNGLARQDGLFPMIFQRALREQNRLFLTAKLVTQEDYHKQTILIEQGYVAASFSSKLNSHHWLGMEVGLNSDGLSKTSKTSILMNLINVYETLKAKKPQKVFEKLEHVHEGDYKQYNCFYIKASNMKYVNLNEEYEGFKQVVAQSLLENGKRNIFYFYTDGKLQPLPLTFDGIIEYLDVDQFLFKEVKERLENNEGMKNNLEHRKDNHNQSMIPKPKPQGQGKGNKRTKRK